MIWKPRFKEAMVEYFLNTRDNVLERSQNAQKNLKRKKKKSFSRFHCGKITYKAVAIILTAYFLS